MKRNVRVILIDKAIAEYNRLNQIVCEQKIERRESTFEIQLIRSINQKIEFIKANSFYGDNIPKKLIPNEYNAGNLWRVELIHHWRMLYTIKGDQIEIICFVLDIMDHKEYDKKFGYRKK